MYGICANDEYLPLLHLHNLKETFTLKRGIET